jgi:glutamine amidotransferase
MGNLRSVQNALNVLGCDAQIVKRPEDLRLAKKVVLPGVGAFGDGMANLQKYDWLEALEFEIKQKGKSFLGLCVGMQVLASVGTEHGRHSGLNWISGIVEKLESDEPAIRVPHIGWNDVRVTKRDGMYAGMKESQSFYFVHSYVLKPNDMSIVSGFSEYGVEFVASIEKDNIWATQYHPEKSQKSGLQVLHNFLKF